MSCRRLHASHVAIRVWAAGESATGIMHAACHPPTLEFLTSLSNNYGEENAAASSSGSRTARANPCSWRLRSCCRRPEAIYVDMLLSLAPLPGLPQVFARP